MLHSMYSDKNWEATQAPIKAYEWRTFEYAEKGEDGKPTGNKKEGRELLLTIERPKTTEGTFAWTFGVPSWNADKFYSKLEENFKQFPCFFTGGATNGGRTVYVDDILFDDGE